MRAVIKIGTQSLLDENNLLDQHMIESLINQIAILKKSGHQIVLVSSGAVGAGRDLWGSYGTHKHFSDTVLEKQILSSIGQASLIESYNASLKRYKMLASQLLLTRYDFLHRRHSVNIGRFLDKLQAQKNILPIINENDSVAVDELIFTDNDELAGLVAAQIGADRLILLTDVDGVLDLSQDPPVVIPEIRHNDQMIDVSLSGGGRGGMESKLKTARKMARIGIQTHIAKARAPDILVKLFDEENLGTVITPQAKKKPVKRWLAAGVQETRGEIIVNDCLSKILHESEGDKTARSILPVGITTITQPFEKDDVVVIKDENGNQIGHGMAKYDHQTLSAYLGQKNKPVFIHYDALHVDPIH